MQKSDQDCQSVYKLKSLGEEPRKKGSNPQINKIFKEALINRRLLVVKAFDSRKMREIERVVVPPSFLDSILSVLHIRLNHPMRSQLRTVFDRYFFSPRMDHALSDLYDSCHLCQSLLKLPKELETYSPALFPNHPGCVMNADILKRAGQLILVNIDMFSGYVTGCFTDSEKADDSANSIIQATTPIRQPGPIVLRVVRAPGLVKLTNSSQSLLSNVGIKLELANHENKNSNCVVDKAINELESELRKLSPSGGPLNSAQLAQALMTLNAKIRQRGYSAAEIHFARDSHDHGNLLLDDEELMSRQKSLRSQNHAYLSKSRAPKAKQRPSLVPTPGDIVFIKNDGSKHSSKDPHIVVTSSSQKSTLRKTLYTSPHSEGVINLSP